MNKVLVFCFALVLNKTYSQNCNFELVKLRNAVISQDSLSLMSHIQLPWVGTCHIDSKTPLSWNSNEFGIHYKKVFTEPLSVVFYALQGISNDTILDVSVLVGNVVKHFTFNACTSWMYICIRDDLNIKPTGDSESSLYIFKLTDSTWILVDYLTNDCLIRTNL